MKIDELKNQLAGHAHVKGISDESGLPMIQLANAAASARVSLYGGQLLSYQPAGESELLFLSEKAWYQPGKSIKGGVPICWPAFGASSPDPSMPFHGFVRNKLWQLVEVEAVSEVETQLIMQTEADAATRKIWPHEFCLTLKMNIGEKLRLELVTENTGQQVLEITQALHTYLSVADINAVTIEGLEQTTYLDKAKSNSGPEQKTQQGGVVFNAEVDRIYLDTAARLQLTDKAGQRCIDIQSTGNKTMVVWNPWQALAQQSADLLDDAYQRFVCIETANAAHDVLVVAPGATVSLAAEYSSRKC